MALVKTSRLKKSADASGSDRAAFEDDAAAEARSARPARSADLGRRKSRSVARQQKTAEKISSIAEELAAGVNDATHSSDELRALMEEIAAGAMETSAAAQESLSAIRLVGERFNIAAQSSSDVERKVTNLTALASRVGQGVLGSVRSVSAAAKRQADLVKLVEDLEQQAASIEEVVKTVARIADQTNLLALNAAIEAARAGQHGKGFAVVADEVRTLAETSEKSANDVQELISRVQSEVKGVSDAINQSATAVNEEIKRAEGITDKLDRMGSDMEAVMASAKKIAELSNAATSSVQEAVNGAESMAASAEEQGAACEETTTMAGQVANALGDSERTAVSLADLAEELKNSTDLARSSEDVSNAADELSASIEEINRAASEIKIAIGDITRGAESTATAVEQASEAMKEIEAGGAATSEAARDGLTASQGLEKLAQEAREGLISMIEGVKTSVNEGEKCSGRMAQLSEVSGRIDKIVDAITTVSVQTGMLAVSGSVEAARAGEFGKGFSVVSTDIRNLARDSAENAERIKDTVEAIQEQIGVVRGGISETLSNSANEVDKSETIVKELDELLSELEGVVKGKAMIVEGGDQVRASLEECSTGVQEIAKATELGLGKAKDAEGSAGRGWESAEALAAAIEEVASLAEDLQG